MGEGRLNVLVVEDEILVRLCVADELQDAGYHVIEAEDGVVALAHLQGATPIDIVFTDIRMPGGIDGWDLAERARALRPDIPVIYATGFAGDDLRLVPGARFPKKPYRTVEIVAAIEALRAR